MATKGPTKATSAGSAVDAASGMAADATMTAKELAAAKRQKKREVDRRCQREARQRTKARIAYLEELVEELRQQDTSGQVASLMEQVSAARSERDQFARTLRGIEDAVRGHQTALASVNEAIAKQEPDSPDEDSITLAVPGAPAQATASIPAYDVAMDMDGATYDDSTMPHSDSKPLLRSSQYASAVTISTAVVPRHAALQPMIRRDSILPPQNGPCMSCEPRNTTDTRPQSLWRFANEVLNAAPRLTEQELEWEDQCAEDTPVRVAVEGWHSVQRRHGGTLPPLWRALRRIDEGIFKGIGPTERLAIMRLMHLLYRYHADPTTQRAKIPPWFLARPSQNIEHAYAIDFICWPGLRERFVFSEHSYCTDLFWHLVNKSLRILWQFDFRDCYIMDLTTNSYRVSPAFDARIADINAWAMGPAFFRPWPELYADIPSWESAVLPMDRISGIPHGSAILAGKHRLMLHGRQIPPGKKLIGIADHYGDADNVVEQENDNGGDDGTDADAEGVDDDELGEIEIARPSNAAAAAVAAASVMRSMDLVPDDDWLWLQGVDGMDTSHMENLGN